MTNPNDKVRDQILRYFYDRNASGTSRFGKRGTAVKISDAKRDLKESYGLTQTQVTSNLTYLIDRQWVKTVEVEKTVQVSGGTIPSTVVWYEITARGIDKIEGESEFQAKENHAGVNITALGSNVITLGDGNVVNVKHETLHRALDDLKSAVTQHPTLSEVDKLETVADIESLQGQLAKSTPDKRVIGYLWKSIETVVTVADLVDYGLKIAPIIAPLMPQLTGL